jgi:hypothetical protein
MSDSSITPRACATSIPVVIFFRKKSFSIPHILGWYVSIRLSMSVYISRSFCESGIRGAVDMIPISTIRISVPIFSRRAYHTVDVPGSIPRMSIYGGLVGIFYG